MLSKAELLGLLVAWSRMGDASLAEVDESLSVEVCVAEERPAVRRAASLVDHVRKRFSYAESPRFGAALNGKSGSCRAMRTRLEGEPAKRAARLAELDAALESVLSNREAYDLVAAEQHPELDALVATLRRLGNPD